MIVSSLTVYPLGLVTPVVVPTDDAPLVSFVVVTVVADVSVLFDAAAFVFA